MATDSTNENEEVSLKTNEFNETAKSARAVWITYITTLSFVIVTIPSLSDLKIFSSLNDLKLPIIGSNVTGFYFLIGASIAVAAIFLYLHYYIERLIHTQSELLTLNNDTLQHARLDPWIVAAFIARRPSTLAHSNKNNTSNKHSTSRPLAKISMVIVWGLVFIGGPLCLFVLWLRSMSIHDQIVTGIIGVLLFLSVFASISNVAKWVQTRKPLEHTPRYRVTLFLQIFAFLSIFCISPLRTSYDYTWYSKPRTLTESSFIGHLVNWFRPPSANLMGLSNGKDADGSSQFDFRHRDLAFANLSESSLDDASFDNAQIRYTNFQNSTIRNSMFAGFKNNLEFKSNNVDFRGVEFADTKFIYLNLNNSSFYDTDIRGVDIITTDISDVRFDRSNIRDSTFYEVSGANAQFRNSVIVKSEYFRVELRSVDFTGADISDVEMLWSRIWAKRFAPTRIQGMQVRFSIFRGSQDEQLQLDLAGIRHESLDFWGTAFRDTTILGTHADVQEVLMNSFGDGSVSLDSSVKRPCQWAKEGEVLAEREFMSRWRGWIELRTKTIWQNVAPEEYADVPANAPRSGCQWKT